MLQYYAPLQSQNVVLKEHRGAGLQQAQVLFGANRSRCISSGLGACLPERAAYSAAVWGPSGGGAHSCSAARGMRLCNGPAWLSPAPCCCRSMGGPPART